MKKEIFIALEDFESNQTATYGTHLAKALDRYAYLFGVVKVPIISPPVIIDGGISQNTVSLQIKQLEDHASRTLENLVNKLKEIHPHIYADLVTGLKESSIIDETEKKDPYLMVIEGSNDLTTMHEWFGTYETRLAENTRTPSLIVPVEHPWKPIRNILYVMDKESENANNMRFLIELSKVFEAKITVVTVATDQNKLDKKHQYGVTKICDELNYTNIDFRQIFTNDVPEALDQLMTEVEANWLAFEHKDRSFLERVFGDYNTKHLILAANRPVLVF